MKRKGIVVAGLLLVLATAGYSQVNNGAYRLLLRGLLQHSVPEIDVPTAARDSASIRFLDAREPREYQVSHLADALFVGYESFDPGRLERPRPA